MQGHNAGLLREDQDGARTVMDINYMHPSLKPSFSQCVELQQ